ncbi:MAG: MmgE/PrpD family protein [Chloroflexi bacterium]|nr:MmgE/PrpD family protein [Chloroflexota bacterium]
MLAAFCNALSACWQELDEGHRLARGHPAIHVVPVVLALGEAQRRRSREALAALVAGYEVAARLGRACLLRPELHPHGVWGALAAAATAVKLQGGEPTLLAGAMANAAALVLAPPAVAALEGATVRNAYAAVACQHGLLAAELARAGVTPPRQVVPLALGQIVGTHWDEQALVDDLGSHFEISRNYFDGPSMPGGCRGRDCNIQTRRPNRPIGGPHESVTVGLFDNQGSIHS